MKPNLPSRGQSMLKGDVTFMQGERYLHTDEIIVERSAQTQEWNKIIAKGNIHFAAPGMSVWGKTAEYIHSPLTLSF